MNNDLIRKDEIRPTRFGTAITVLLVAMTMISVVAYGAVDTWGIALMALFATVIALVWIAESWKIGALSFNSNLIQLSLAGLIFIGLVQLLPLRGTDLSALITTPASQSLTLDAHLTKLALIKLFVYLIFFAAALNYIVTGKRFRRVIFTIITFGAIMAVFAILQKLLNPENIYGTRETIQASIFGPYVNGHHFAALMEMTLGLSLGLLYGRSVRKELRVIFLIAAILMGVAIVMTGSRGGLLSFFGVLGFVTIASLFSGKNADKKSESGQTKLLLIGGGLTFVLIMAGIGLMLSGDTAMRGIGIEGVGQDISTGRFHFWYVAFEIFKHNFILGAGLDAFGVAFTQYDTWNGVFRLENAHNDYLQILAEAGIPGFVCVAGFIYFLFSQGLKTIRTTNEKLQRNAAIGALAGCFGVMIHSFFDFPLRTPANVLMFLLLTTIAITSVKHSKH